MNRSEKLVIVLALAITCVLTPLETAAAVWSGQSSIHPGTQFDDYFPRITMTPDATPWVVWMGVDPVENDQEVFYSSWNGSGWEPPGTVNPPNAWPDRIPQISCAPDGTLWVLWNSARTDVPDQYLGLVSRKVFGGWTFPDTVWTDATRYQNYDFHAIGATEAWFVREANGGVNVYHHAGTTRDPPSSFIPGGATAYQPSIAVDTTGVVYVIWTHDIGLSQDDPLEFTRLVGGAWESPQTIDGGPLGTSLPRLTIDRSNRVWIVTAAVRSSLPYGGGDIWALRWGGASWEPMIRISDEIQANDSLQTWPTVTRIRGEDPRAVWVRAPAVKVTRYDVLTSAWDGIAWSPPELVGDLADSSYVNWPDIAQRGSQIWATWMRDAAVAPYVFNIVSVRSIPGSVAATAAEFSAELRGTEVLLRWRSSGFGPSVAARVLRGALEVDEGGRPSNSRMIGEFFGPDAQDGRMTDQLTIDEPSAAYWLALVQDDGQVRHLGPRSMSLTRSAVQTRLTGAFPSPTIGEIRLRGVVGSDHPVEIQVFSVVGRLVRALPLRDGAGMANGSFTALWDARDQSGKRVPSGIYLARSRSVGQMEPSATIRFLVTR